MRKQNSLLALLMTMSLVGGGNAGQIKVDALKYGVVIESSRIIYPSDSTGSVLPVENPQSYPVLVQTKILTEQKDKSAPFFVSPPLFRLDSGKRYSLRITKTGDDFPQDKERLFWICVKGIPPKADDLWAEKKGHDSSNKDIGVMLNISIDNCIKLILRPDKLEGRPLDYANQISWKKSGNELIGYNKSAFYMNLGSVSFNGMKLTPDYIPPGGERRFPLESSVANSGTVTWNVIDDYGAMSTDFSIKI
ncbi:molecular chaperone [Salmonella enterica]|nr:molecular chaperone [Salmonella enterica]